MESTIIRFVIQTEGQIIRQDLLDETGQDIITEYLNRFENLAKAYGDQHPDLGLDYILFGYMRVFVRATPNDPNEIWIDLTDKPKLLTGAEHDQLLENIPYNSQLLDIYRGTNADRT